MWRPGRRGRGHRPLTPSCHLASVWFQIKEEKGPFGKKRTGKKKKKPSNFLLRKLRAVFLEMMHNGISTF